MLDNYMAKDRSTRKRKTIDYDTYASYCSDDKRLFRIETAAA